MNVPLHLRRAANWTVKRALFTVSSSPSAGPLRVFAYHSVDDTGSTLSIHPEEFAEHLDLLKRDGWSPLTASEYLLRVRGGVQGRRECLLTFDDGYENFYSQAAPLLREFGFPATVFVPTDFIGQQPKWFVRDHDKISSFLRRFRFSDRDLSATSRMMEIAVTGRLMTSAQIKELACNGIDFQSHSAGHHFLPVLDQAELSADLERSTASLEEITGARPFLLAYPYGVCDDRVARAATSAGYLAAFISEYKGKSLDQFRMGRIGVAGSLGLFHIRFALSSALDQYVNLRRS